MSAVSNDMTQSEARAKAPTLGLATTYRKPARFGGGTAFVSTAELIRRIEAVEKHGQGLLKGNGVPSVAGRWKFKSRMDRVGQPHPTTPSWGSTSWWFDAAHTDESAESAPEPEAPEVPESAPEAPKPVAVPAVVSDKAVTQAAPAAGDAAALGALIQRIAGGAIDESKVRAIVAEVVGDVDGRILRAVEEGLSNVKPTKIEITLNGGAPVTIEGPEPTVFQRVLARVGLKANIMLVGPAGCGKTHLAGMVAAALKRRFAFISCSAGMSEGALLGRLLPTGEGGAWKYVPSTFVECYEGGGVFLLDEVDAADANTMVVLNAALANGHLALPSRPENPIAKRHPEFVLIAAANTYGTGANRQYAGRNQLDAATLDRFAVTECGYDPAVEAEPRVSTAVQAWGRSIRAKLEAKGIRRFMSTRRLMYLTTALEAGRSLPVPERVKKGLDWKSLRDEAFAGWAETERTQTEEGAPHVS